MVPFCDPQQDVGFHGGFSPGFQQKAGFGSSHSSVFLLQLIVPQREEEQGSLHSDFSRSGDETKFNSLALWFALQNESQNSANPV